MSMRSAAACALGAGLILGACAKESPEGERPASPEPQVVEITTAEYAFTAPSAVQAGRVTFRMNAGGQVFHHAQLIRLDAGHSLGELLSLHASDPTALPAWAHRLGGPNGADPGASTEVTMDVAPGEYALICEVMAADGMTHLTKGMGHALTVRGPASAQPRPEADVTLSISASGFALSGPVQAGRRSLLVENVDSAVHEAVIVRLADGASAQGVLDWIMGGMRTAPPASGNGGIAPMAGGLWNLAHADFAPGRYAVLDFTPGSDGRPKAAHGMLAEFEVK